MSELPEKIPLIILDSSESQSLFVTCHTKYMVELPPFPSFEWDFLVIDTPKGEDLILGFDFLNHFNPSIYWKKGLITFTAEKKDYYDPSSSFSNYFCHRGSSGNTRVAWHSAIRELTWKTPKNKEIK
ncbi:hypothetical protein O181_064441 [Austropuccinia psidii MF-1]|uniref:Uncharacterized protein n=1 Tax=Austropuccinia psidii MF-1 TaxID=1389203 RepID=A0A9Q3I0A1_9BASI|nr:hypothetical protein [Austropuccinia psidii MF-1]